MTKVDLTRRIALDSASRATLGSNFGVTEKVGLHIAGPGITSR